MASSGLSTGFIFLPAERAVKEQLTLYTEQAVTLSVSSNVNHRVYAFFRGLSKQTKSLCGCSSEAPQWKATPVSLRRRSRSSSLDFKWRTLSAWFRSIQGVVGCQKSVPVQRKMDAVRKLQSIRPSGRDFQRMRVYRSDVVLGRRVEKRVSSSSDHRLDEPPRGSRRGIPQHGCFPALE